MKRNHVGDDRINFAISSSLAATFAVVDLAPEKFRPLTFDKRSGVPKTCGRKPMVYSIEIGTRTYAVKPTRTSDPIAFDRIKSLFGLASLNAQGVRLPYAFTCEPASAATGGRQVHKIERLKPGAYQTYFITELVPDAVMLQIKVDSVSVTRPMALAALKIALVRGLFRVSDFCPRNVLVDDRGGAWSLDENKMFAATSILCHATQARKMLRMGKVVTADVKRLSAEVVQAFHENKGEMMAALMRGGLLSEDAASRIIELAACNAETLQAQARQEFGGVTPKSPDCGAAAPQAPCLT